MPLPNLDIYCSPNAVSSRLCITFPGGAQICGLPTANTIPDPSEAVNALLAQANVALAPLVPIFNIIDCVVAVVNCIKAVGKAIASFPPRPDKLAACFPDLAKKLGKLLQLIPQLSIPVLVGSLLDALIAFLRAIRSQLLAVIKHLLFVVQSQSRAAALGSIALFGVIGCANSDMDAYLANMNENAKPIGQIMKIVNLFLGLAGLDPIGTNIQFTGAAEDSVKGIDITIKVLQGVRTAFP
jgi:hypothetical protein